MKTETFPSLHVDPELRQAAEEVLQDGESLSSFVEQSIRESIERRQVQREFIACGLRFGDDGHRSGRYVRSGAVDTRLVKMLAGAGPRIGPTGELPGSVHGAGRGRSRWTL